MPALTLVVLACFPLAYAWMLPEQLDEFGNSAVASLTGWSNILFWLKSGYFAEAAELKPLLHTWSLSVEEQFYLVFPVLFLAMSQLGLKRLGLVFTALALVSLYFALSRFEWASFFMTPGRVWELLAGVGAAIWLSRRPPLEGMAAEAASLAGLAGLAVSVLGFTEATAYPGLATVIPVMSAVGIILSRPVTRVAWALSLPPLVYVGLASYSIYLWHQPVLAFARLRSLDTIDKQTGFLLVCLSVGLGFASWWFVERPTRNRATFSAARFFGTMATGIVLAVAAGSYLTFNSGLPQRLSSLGGYAEVRTIQPEMSGCDWYPIDETLPYLLVCRFGSAAPQKAVAIFGDSHAEMYGPQLQQVFDGSDVAGILIRNAYCGTIPGIHNDGPAMNLNVALDCPRALSVLFRWLHPQNVVSVLIANRWTYRLFPTPGEIEDLTFDNGEGGVESAGYVESYTLLTDGTPSHLAGDRRAAVQVFIDRLDQELDVPIVLVYPVPEVGWDIAQRNLKTLLFDGQVEQEISTSSDRFLARNAFAIDLLDGLVSSNLRRVKPSSVLCDNILAARCVAQLNGRPLYHDDDHLSALGLTLIFDSIVSALGL